MSANNPSQQVLLENSCDCGKQSYVLTDENTVFDFHTNCPNCIKKIYHLWCEEHGASFAFQEKDRNLDLLNNTWKCLYGKEKKQIPTQAHNKIFPSYFKEQVPPEIWNSGKVDPKEFEEMAEKYGIPKTSGRVLLLKIVVGVLVVFVLIFFRLYNGNSEESHSNIQKHLNGFLAEELFPGEYKEVTENKPFKLKYLGTFEIPKSDNNEGKEVYYLISVNQNEGLIDRDMFAAYQPPGKITISDTEGLTVQQHIEKTYRIKVKKIN